MYMSKSEMTKPRRDEEDDVELQPDSPTREAEIEEADFEDFVVIDDEVATSTEPDPQVIFQSMLSEARMSVKASSTGGDAEESDDETEMVKKAEGRGRQAHVSAAEVFCYWKMPRDTERGIANAVTAFTDCL
ncbi:hypothetical protein TTRE_0000421801 [Trichuris trichiura]|uniref:Uncharacterized protein n=1 Tax=Trichuris trichiura TaxID=36087 RepID=A0A077Z851_TRITR|nr:hypothetical protein TTRE_0000421801 [Trichuris trichiura]